MVDPRPNDERFNPQCDECHGDAVLSAAIRKGKLVFSMRAPARHDDVIKAMVEAGIPPPIGPGQGFEQGFMTRYGYKDRELTGVLIHGECRFITSEDLW